MVLTWLLTELYENTKQKTLEILEYCKIEDLLERENHYFNILKPEYNISKESSSPILGRKHSE
jgi:hypothetical protein